MKFRGIKPYTEAQSVEEYLRNSMRADLLELVDGLHRLDLVENMEAFSYEGTINAGTEIEIRNPLSTPPSGRLVVKHSGDPGIVDGDKAWDSDFVYLKNTGAASATVKIIYFK